MPDDAALARRCARYGITVEQYDAMLEWQGGVCLLCLRKFTRSRPACIDHEHRTGRWRGLLCSRCNFDLGVLQEDAAWLGRAAQYLRHPPAPHLFPPIYHPDAPPRQETP